MTHVDDLYEPGDDREPAEPEQEPPLDLEAIKDSIRVYYAGSDDDSLKAAEDLLMVSSRLVAELREARQRIAEWEALPGREEFATTDQQTSTIPPNKHHPYRVTAGEALKASEKGRQGWVRRLTVHPWEPIDDKGPF